MTEAIQGKTKYQRLTVRIGLALIKRIESVIARDSLVGTGPFIGREEFPWVRQLEAGWWASRREAEALLEDGDRLPRFQEISRDQVNISQDDRWKTFFLHGYGYKFPSNCARCPETTRLVESVPGMTTAFFSILGPGKHIPPHRGPYKGVVRCHLALMVPPPAERCGIEVGGETANWEEGRCLIFDDTYQHQAWNDTEGTRVVLFLDVVRPLRAPASVLNRAVLKLIQWSPYVQDARRNQRAWERRWGD